MRRNHATLALRDYQYDEPLRGSRVGNIVARSCANCHSDETNWPWYSRIAPVSWWIESHVREGRTKLDFSQWSSYSVYRQRDELESICGVISIGRMPPAVYVAGHPEAKLGREEKKAMCAWADAAKQRVK